MHALPQPGPRGVRTDRPATDHPAPDRPATDRPATDRQQVHLVELTMLEEHNYSAVLGYLHAAIRTDPELDAALVVRTHIGRTLTTGFDQVVEDFLAGLDDPALVAFTVYFWNRPESVRIAARVVSRWPRCRIVFGGNDVTHQQDALFQEAPFTDVLVHGEGELRFREVCRSLLMGRGALADVPGISYRSSARGAEGPVEVHTTREAERIADLDLIPSPLLTDVYSDAELGSTRLIIYETNRGCPYSCAFCFWGGATNSKVRQFPMARVEAELERITRCARDGSSVFIADANFGILGRDLRIAELFVQLCARHGKRLTLMTNWAKNSNSKVVEIASVLHEHGLSGAITLSAQSFDPATLEIARRSNIKVDRYRTLQREFLRRSIPTYTDLIWGLPGESLATHLDGVEEVLQAGGCPVVYPLLTLNNTEYASQTFGRVHRLVTRRMPCDISDPSLAADVVVGHERMDFEDWRRGMQHYVLTAVFAKSAMRATLRWLSVVTGARIVDMVGVLLDAIEEGLAACPQLTPLLGNHREALDRPDRLDMELIDSVLGEQKTVLEELHYQAMMYVVLDDAQVHRAVLSECTALLVQRLGLVGAGLGDLPGVHSLDAVAGSMWRAGSGSTPLSGMFAVSARALAVLVEHGDVPQWPFDPAAGVVSGRATACAERIGYWNTAYAMSLLRGARRLLFDADTRLVFGGLPPDPRPSAAPAAVGAVIAAAVPVGSGSL